METEGDDRVPRIHQELLWALIASTNKKITQMWPCVLTPLQHTHYHFSKSPPVANQRWLLGKLESNPPQNSVLEPKRLALTHRSHNEADEMYAVVEVQSVWLGQWELDSLQWRSRAALGLGEEEVREASGIIHSLSEV